MMPIVIGYASLRVIWWLLIGILLMGFAVTDGFDLGVAMLLRFVGKTDAERRVTINTVAPVWEGNQVWLILGAGAIFAAWPMVYAITFSEFYLAMMLALFPLIMRPVGFKFRSKITDPNWRAFWDWSLTLSGFFPALVFGVAIGNVLQGTWFYFDPDLRMIDNGRFIQLFNPFALLTGVLSVSMLVMHGGYYLAVKCVDPIRERALRFARFATLLTLLLFLIAGVWVVFGLDGYVITSNIDHAAPSNPLFKTVEKVTGGWLYNYRDWPVFWLAPAIAVISAMLAFIFSNRQSSKPSFITSGLTIIGMIATFGLSMFPFILPSRVDAASSLTVWDSSSSHLTLYIMLISVVIFLPIILSYTAWVYRVMRGKVTEKYLENEPSAY